jgi:ribose/xylose/arabinose/galactoside ABC-type transport system permease subunit
MSDLGRLLVAIGVLLVVCGVVVLLLGKTGQPLGRLPGDLTWRDKHTTVYFPLGTSILISVVLSLIFWLRSRWGK